MDRVILSDPDSEVEPIEVEIQSDQEFLYWD